MNGSVRFLPGRAIVLVVPGIELLILIMRDGPEAIYRRAAYCLNLAVVIVIGIVGDVVRAGGVVVRVFDPYRLVAVLKVR